MTRGRPKSATPRVSVSLRVEADVLDWWRSTGKGWQTRMSGLLRSAAFSEGIEARLVGQTGTRQDTVPTVDHVTHIDLTDKPTSMSVADVTRAVEKIDEDHPLVSLPGWDHPVRIDR